MKHCMDSKTVPIFNVCWKPAQSNVHLNQVHVKICEYFHYGLLKQEFLDAHLNFKIKLSECGNSSQSDVEHGIIFHWG